MKNATAIRRHVVEPELEVYRERTLSQFDVVLEYAKGQASIDEFAEEILSRDVYVRAMRPDLSRERRNRVREDLLDRQRRLGDAVEPLVNAPEETFWDAVCAELEVAEACEMVEEQFVFTGPLVAHRDAFRFTAELDVADVVGGFGRLFGGGTVVEVEYTDEALRAMRRAERAIVAQTTAEIERRVP
ncbi:hypothetical protein VB779_12700 [Haloarculaceae archaeon H-GB11]|nr:hypothetical protein [Haloarculaceae archaeon H-GB11]